MAAGECAALVRMAQADTDLEWFDVVRLGDGRLAVCGSCQGNVEYGAMGLQALSLKYDA